MPRAVVMSPRSMIELPAEGCGGGPSPCPWRGLSLPETKTACWPRISAGIDHDGVVHGVEGLHDTASRASSRWIISPSESVFWTKRRRREALREIERDCETSMRILPSRFSAPAWRRTSTRDVAAGALDDHLAVGGGVAEGSRLAAGAFGEGADLFVVGGCGRPSSRRGRARRACRRSPARPHRFPERRFS